MATQATPSLETLELQHKTACELRDEAERAVCEAQKWETCAEAHAIDAAQLAESARNSAHEYKRKREACEQDAQKRRKECEDARRAIFLHPVNVERRRECGIAAVVALLDLWPDTETERAAIARAKPGIVFSDALAHVQVMMSELDLEPALSIETHMTPLMPGSILTEVMRTRYVVDLLLSNPDDSLIVHAHYYTCGTPDETHPFSARVSVYVNGLHATDFQIYPQSEESETQRVPRSRASVAPKRLEEFAPCATASTRFDAPAVLLFYRILVHGVCHSAVKHVVNDTPDALNCILSPVPLPIPDPDPL